MSRFKDLTGQIFGRLVAISPTEKRLGHYVVWKCVCDCGNIAFVASSDLRTGNTRSCGCLHAETMRRIGAETRNNKDYCEKRDKQFKEWNSLPENKVKLYEALGRHDGTQESSLNNTVPSNSTTGVRGVMFRKDTGKYSARIVYKRKVYSLGCFDTLDLAKEAREIAEREIWGKEL